MPSTYNNCPTCGERPHDDECPVDQLEAMTKERDEARAFEAAAMATVATEREISKLLQAENARLRAAIEPTAENLRALRLHLPCEAGRDAEGQRDSFVYGRPVDKVLMGILAAIAARAGVKP